MHSSTKRVFAAALFIFLPCAALAQDALQVTLTAQRVAQTNNGREKLVPADQAKPWMRYAGMVDSGDSRSSQRIDEIVYGRKK